MSGGRRGAGWAVVLSVGLTAAPPQQVLREVYLYSCASCHGVDGKAKGPGGVRLPGRVLADRKWYFAQPGDALVASILEGKGAMPGFKYKLSPEDARRMLAEVVAPMARRAR